MEGVTHSAPFECMCTCNRRVWRGQRGRKGEQGRGGEGGGERQRETHTDT